MPDITNVKLGVCSVEFNSEDLGHTKGGATLIYEPTYHDVTVDQYGETVSEKYLIGEKLTVEVNLAEFSIDNLAVAIPAGTKAGADDARLEIGKEAGLKMSDLAATLVLHPIANEASDRSEDVVIFKAIASEPVELPYQIDGERVFAVKFVAIIDESQEDGSYLGLIGDSLA